jgi:hypothetical protein
MGMDLLLAVDAPAVHRRREALVTQTTAETPTRFSDHDSASIHAKEQQQYTCPA